MDWKSLTIEDAEIFKNHMGYYRYRTYDILFTNMFMWSFLRRTAYKIIDGFLCIKGELEGVEYLYFPVGEGELRKTIKALLEEFGQGFKMRAVNKDMIALLKKEFPKTFVYELEYGRGDYLYKTDDLVELKGKKYHSKKNFVNRFEKTYSYTYENIGPENIREVLEFQKWWCEIKGCSLRGSLKDEKVGVIRVLENYEKLNLSGGLIRVDGKVVAFSIGEAINYDTAVVHIEKADHNYIGAYQMINKLFIENEFLEYKYINREEDLGIPQLEKAKLSYNPVKILEKNRVFLRK